MTDIFYYSNNSKPCSKILQDLEKIPHIRSKFQYVSIDTNNPQHNIQVVPAIILEGRILQGKQVFDWLESEKHNNTLPAFEVGFGTNNFSSIQNQDAPAENNFNFTYIETTEHNNNIQEKQQPNTDCGRKPKINDNALDDLINQRKMEIPIPRQRS